MLQTCSYYNYDYIDIYIQLILQHNRPLYFCFQVNSTLYYLHELILTINLTLIHIHHNHHLFPWQMMMARSYILITMKIIEVTRWKSSISVAWITRWAGMARFESDIFNFWDFVLTFLSQCRWTHVFLVENFQKEKKPFPHWDSGEFQDMSVFIEKTGQSCNESKWRYSSCNKKQPPKAFKTKCGGNQAIGVRTADVAFKPFVFNLLQNSTLHYIKYSLRNIAPKLRPLGENLQYLDTTGWDKLPAQVCKFSSNIMCNVISIQ